MADAGLLGDAPITLIAGPEEYLFGEEKALLEVIEGNDPMPRWLPPYLHGLFATTPQEGWSAGSGPVDADDAARVGSNPTLVIERRDVRQRAVDRDSGAPTGTARSGPPDTPGPLICTVVGDVTHAGFAEIEPGMTLREVIDRIGGGVGAVARSKRCCRACRILRSAAAQLDAPVSYEGLAAAGGGLGSAGFIVYDDIAQHGLRRADGLTFPLRRIVRPMPRVQVRVRRDHPPPRPRSPRRAAMLRDIEVIGERLRAITDQNRCFLGEEEQRVIASLLRLFPEDFTTELEGAPPLEPLPVPKIVDIHDGVAIYDENQMRKQPDWTYAATS